MTSTLPPLVQAFAGGIGSVIANAGSFPLDVVVTRLQTQNSSNDLIKKRKLNALDIIDDIIGHDGYRGLYAGFASDSLATLISNFIYYYAYSFIRSNLLERRAAATLRIKSIPSPTPWPFPPPRRGPPVLSTAEELGAGFVAGVISRFASTPLNIVTVRLQVEKDASEGRAGRPASILSVMKHIYREEGILGFWRGFHSTILLCSNPAITLFLFQTFRRLMLRGRDRDIPTASQSFIGAATSNAVAIALLYPLILVKTRLQSARSKHGGATVITTVQRVVEQRGWQGLYDGLNVQLLKGILNQGMTMMTKQRIEAGIVALYLISRRKSVAL